MPQQDEYTEYYEIRVSLHKIQHKGRAHSSSEVDRRTVAEEIQELTGRSWLVYLDALAQERRELQKKSKDPQGDPPSQLPPAGPWPRVE